LNLNINGFKQATVSCNCSRGIQRKKIQSATHPLLLIRQIAFGTVVLV